MTVEEMKEVIDVESYEIDTQSIIHDNIDVVLHSNGLFRLDAFSYTVGDCLFDTFQVLLHFQYSSTKLRNGLIDYFLAYFKNGDVEALQSYEYEMEQEAQFLARQIENPPFKNSSPQRSMSICILRNSRWYL